MGAGGGQDGTLDLAAGLTSLLTGSGSGPSFDDLGQLSLLLGVKEGDHADLVQVLTNGITHFASHSLVLVPGGQVTRAEMGLSGGDERLGRVGGRFLRFRLT